MKGGNQNSTLHQKYYVLVRRSISYYSDNLQRGIRRLEQQLVSKRSLDFKLILAKSSAKGFENRRKRRLFSLSSSLDSCKIGIQVEIRPPFISKFESPKEVNRNF